MAIPGWGWSGRKLGRVPYQNEIEGRIVRQTWCTCESRALSAQLRQPAFVTLVNEASVHFWTCVDVCVFACANLRVSEDVSEVGMRTYSHAHPEMRPNPPPQYFGWTPLQYAVRYGTPAVVTALLASRMAAGVDALATYEVACPYLLSPPSQRCTFWCSPDFNHRFILMYLSLMYSSPSSC